MRRSGLGIAVICSVAVAALAACGHRIPHPPYVPHETSELVEVAFPPPPARVEGVPPRPDDDAVWIDGEWTWRGRRWAWSPGRWVVSPEGSAFSPWTSVIRDDGVVFFAPGVWKNAITKAPIDPPKALNTANVSAGIVFEPGGDIQRTGPTIDPDRQRRRSSAAADGGS